MIAFNYLLSGKKVAGTFFPQNRTAGPSPGGLLATFRITTQSSANSHKDINVLRHPLTSPMCFLTPHMQGSFQLFYH